MAFGLRSECNIASKKPLHFTVMSVTVVTLPMSMGFLHDGPYPELSGRHFIVRLPSPKERLR